eukprot:maker-scaffold336_size202805-snap-gene-1.44 protein:Tk02909 transcript:maker-scaffold336_size202805-snap-gene-1.44-mRNA-1 annotation:"splicing arginine serine-rich 16"
MWQEARKQEKKLRGMMVDHKKRAERRREYYEKIKLDPTQFLQVHGRRSKIHLDIHVALAGDDPKTMMPWQGDKEIMIDRFDVRAHLDYIPDVKANASDDFDQESEKRLREINYERYRILVQNDFVKVGETRFLKTIELEEQFGGKTYQAQKAKDDKKKSKESKAAIAFTYEDSTTVEPKAPAESGKRDQDDAPNDPDGGDDSDSDIDLDMTVDIMAMGHESRQEINGVGKSYRMGREDFMKFLAQDIHEQEELKAAKLAEEERAQHTGRKSRRERRLLKERRMVGRRLSPPSYASRHMTIRTFGSGRPEVGDEDEGSGHNSSRSPSPVIPGKVEFITSFGGDSDSERKNDVAIGSSRMSSTSKSRLKNLRRNLSPSPRSDIPIGPMLPLGAGQLRRPSQTQHSRRARSPFPKVEKVTLSESIPKEVVAQHVQNSTSQTPVEVKITQTTTRSVERRKSPARSRKASPSSDSSSSSSSSAGNGTKPDVKYRSKYRNRRRSSSSESEGKPEKNATDKGKNNGKSVGKRGRSSSSSTSSPSPMRKQSVEVETKPEPAKPIQSYYERIRQNVVKDSDSDDLDVEPDEHSQLSKPKHRDDSNGDGRNDTNPDTKSNDREASNSLKDKIRKRMQAQIKKQFRMDKLAEEERKRKLDEERLYREEEMRELALKMRRKEREKRHDFDSGSESEPVRPSSSNSDDKDDRKRGQVPGQSASRGEHQPKSRSESRSPKRRRSRDRSRSREQLHRTRPLSPNGDKGKIRLT